MTYESFPILELSSSDFPILFCSRNYVILVASTSFVWVLLEKDACDSSCPMVLRPVKMQWVEVPAD